jgi:hypothetical protein
MLPEIHTCQALSPTNSQQTHYWYKVTERAGAALRMLRESNAVPAEGGFGRIVMISA